MKDAPFDEEAWAALIGAGLGLDVEVRFTRARKTVLVLTHGPRRLGRDRALVRMQRFFADAPPEVRGAVVTWLRSGRRAPRAGRTLDAWIEQRLQRLWREAPRHGPAARDGAVHDLCALSEGLFEEEFAREFAPADSTAEPGASPPARPRITWGRRGPSRSRHSLRLGSFDYHSGVVRVHPVLDQEAVPAWFVRYVLFHELLHAALPMEIGARGRRVYHGPRFRGREATYADTARAKVWEAAHLEALIRSARTGRAMRVEAQPAAKRSETPIAAHNARGARTARGGRRSWVQRLFFAER